MIKIIKDIKDKKIIKDDKADKDEKGNNIPKLWIEPNVYSLSLSLSVISFFLFYFFSLCSLLLCILEIILILYRSYYLFVLFWGWSFSVELSHYTHECKVIRARKGREKERRKKTSRKDDAKRYTNLFSLL